MNEETKRKSPASPDPHSEPAGEKNNPDVSGFVGRQNESRTHGASPEPVRISQEEAQSIPADKDPDDPVSR